MTVRTFKQQGAVFAPINSNVNLVAKINGQEVFNGSVSTINEPYPINNWTDDVIDLFTWTDETALSSTTNLLVSLSQDLEITVTGGTLMLRDTLANFCISPSNSNPGTFVSSGPDFFGLIYSERYNDTDTMLTDPLTNVTIDDVPQRARHEDGPMGQWIWKIESGSTFTATVTTNNGFESV